jgi:ATP synthase protein I
MDTELKKMVKKVLLADIVIVILVGIVSSLLFKEYVIALIAGLIVAFINFILNVAVSNYVVAQGGNKLINLFGIAFRIIITLVIAIVLCGTNRNKYIAILLGYTFHYFAIIFYGLTAKDKIIERK